MRRRVFSIVYDAEVAHHLQSIEAKHYSLIRESIEAQLTHQPEVETKNRKPLRRVSPLGATWEIRFGPDNQFRVFYKIEPKLHEVRIVAIGVKVRNRLWIGGVEVAA